MSPPRAHLDDAAMHRLVHRAMVLPFAVALTNEAAHLEPLVYGPFEPGPMEALANAVQDSADDDPFALMDRISIQFHPIVHDALLDTSKDSARASATVALTIVIPALVQQHDPLAAPRILARLRKAWSHRRFSLDDANSVGARHFVRVESVAGEYIHAAEDEAVAVMINATAQCIFERESKEDGDDALEAFPAPPA